MVKPLGEGEGRGGGREEKQEGGGKGKAQECSWEGEQGGVCLFLRHTKNRLIVLN